MHIIRNITKIAGNAHETTIIVVQLQNVAVCVKAFNYISYALHELTCPMDNEIETGTV